jgi:hypothetical protein
MLVVAAVLVVLVVRVVLVALVVLVLGIILLTLEAEVLVVRPAEEQTNTNVRRRESYQR